MNYYSHHSNERLFEKFKSDRFINCRLTVLLHISHIAVTMNVNGEPTNLLDAFDDADETELPAPPPPAFGPKPPGKKKPSACPSHIAYRISHIAFRISHFAYRISHIAFRTIKKYCTCRDFYKQGNQARHGG